MAGVTRILLLDLLVEMPEFGHGGNQEVIKPFLKSTNVEVLLVTPQMQSLITSKKLDLNSDITLTKEDIPNWNYDIQYWASMEVDIENKKIPFRRIIMPMYEDVIKMRNWLEGLSVDAVVCSGSRRNVSIWEKWMGPSATLMEASSTSGIPTLGICFGHQLLCYSLGGKVERASTKSSGIWDLELTNTGKNDELLTSHIRSDSPISVLYTHQDHVSSISERCIILAKTTHNKITAIRVNDDTGNSMPAWGLQFHPEVTKKRIKRAFEGGHITEEEYNSFKGEHKGASILTSFANIVLNIDNKDIL
jgi:GMP synthase-like glutamine amidotransferase